MPPTLSEPGVVAVAGGQAGDAAGDRRRLALRAPWTGAAGRDGGHASDLFSVMTPSAAAAVPFALTTLPAVIFGDSTKPAGKPNASVATVTEPVAEGHGTLGLHDVRPGGPYRTRAPSSWRRALCRAAGAAGAVDELRLGAHVGADDDVSAERNGLRVGDRDLLVPPVASTSEPGRTLVASTMPHTETVRAWRLPCAPATGASDSSAASAPMNRMVTFFISRDLHKGLIPGQPDNSGYPPGLRMAEGSPREGRS